MPALAAMVFLAGCSSAPAPANSPKSDPTTEAWYGRSVNQLTALNREAESAFQSGKPDRAAALIQQGEPIRDRILSTPRTTIAAAEAASDLDDLYGRMLLANRHYGWARLLFQKNLARWKHWAPNTPESTRRFRQAESAIAECDRRLAR
ncbi:MAG: hypothetical protein M3Z09_04750 [Acidobacteriota bacterium]|nr:hypothetical protein [Acidobacteriota bacterium]